jgi:hypothetical protein
MQAFAFLKYGLLLAAVVAIAFGAYDALIVGDLAAGQWELVYGMLSAACFWWLDWRERRR